MKQALYKKKKNCGHVFFFFKVTICYKPQGWKHTKHYHGFFQCQEIIFCQIWAIHVALQRLKMKE